ncbi:MAG: hypothetical protein J6X11_12685 [Treponema sp.]|nr:hypothetical protein [Treponema sp.]
MKMLINPCKECYICQNVEQIYGCAQKDDMTEIAWFLYKKTTGAQGE